VHGCPDCIDCPDIFVDREAFLLAEETTITVIYIFGRKIWRIFGLAKTVFQGAIFRAKMSLDGLVYEVFFLKKMLKYFDTSVGMRGIFAS